VTRYRRNPDSTALMVIVALGLFVIGMAVVIR